MTVHSTSFASLVAFQLAASVLATVPWGGILSAEDAADQAVAYQINPAHDGAIETEGLTPPLKLAWQVELDDVISYPLIAEGKVFVLIRGDNNDNYGTRLLALDASSGAMLWGPVVIGGTYFWSGFAYWKSRIYVLNVDGLLRAFAADTGARAWGVAIPGGGLFSCAPVVVDGTIYVEGSSSAGGIYALSAEDGRLLWNAATAEGGDHASPAVAGDAVFLGHPCRNAYRFNRLTGILEWQANPQCSGTFGGGTPVYHDGRLYVRSYWPTRSGYALDAESGRLLWESPYSLAPAFLGSRGFFVSTGELECRDAASGKVLWSFAQEEIPTAPIVVNGLVYVGSAAGTLYALEPETGKVVWRTETGWQIRGPNEGGYTEPTTGLGAGQGILVVPAVNHLLCYVSASPPTSFRRADPNADGTINIVDVVVILRHILGIQQAISCLDSADCDDNGKLDVSDPVYLLRWLFNGEAAPGEPFEACGPDPDGDALACGSYPMCA